MAKTKRTTDIPGTIYKNGNRYWWKVKLPGEDKVKSYPLKPVGSTQATKDKSVAEECARYLWAKAIFESEKTITGRPENIAELAKAYTNYANKYYLDDNGNPTSEPLHIRYALKPLIDLYGSLAIEEFGPLKLMDVREKMIKLGWCRKQINKQICKIKRMFKWAVSTQLISSFLYQALATIEGLKRGRSAAKEGKKVKPIDEKHVYQILNYATPVIATMVELQLLTGMRPGELVQMKPKDIDRSDEVWHYFPERHKNEYRGHERIVPLGPQGQRILMPFLLRNADSYCFSPAESEKFRLEKRTEDRQTPLSCGNTVGSNRKDNPQKQPGDHYDSCSYAKAVKAAIDAARKDIKARGGDPDEELPKWTPYQLRHTAATKARKLFNYETAGALLGHSNMSATAIYAERNQGLADEVAKKLG
ncbi:MAG: site-specific integrase [Phycisphaerae bacterium]|nr:site-specific integrase [Phycisphaerae bacterium]